MGARGREVVFGQVGRPWKPVGASAGPTITPEAFPGFDRPGFAKIAFSLSVSAHGRTASIVTLETRVALTDPASRKKFDRYWLVVGALRRPHRPAALRLIAADVDLPAGTASGDQRRAAGKASRPLSSTKQTPAPPGWGCTSALFRCSSWSNGNADGLRIGARALDRGRRQTLDHNVLPARSGPTRARCFEDAVIRVIHRVFSGRSPDQFAGSRVGLRACGPARRRRSARCRPGVRCLARLRGGAPRGTLLGGASASVGRLPLWSSQRATVSPPYGPRSGCATAPLRAGIGRSDDGKRDDFSARRFMPRC